jgi:hypothetical protein
VPGRRPERSPWRGVRTVRSSSAAHPRRTEATAEAAFGPARAPRGGRVLHRSRIGENEGGGRLARAVADLAAGPRPRLDGDVAALRAPNVAPAPGERRRKIFPAEKLAGPAIRDGCAPNVSGHVRGGKAPPVLRHEVRPAWPEVPRGGPRGLPDAGGTDSFDPSLFHHRSIAPARGAERDPSPARRRAAPVRSFRNVAYCGRWRERLAPGRIRRLRDRRPSAGRGEMAVSPVMQGSWQGWARRGTPRVGRVAFRARVDGFSPVSI